MPKPSARDIRVMGKRMAKRFAAVAPQEPDSHDDYKSRKWLIHGLTVLVNDIRVRGPRNEAECKAVLRGVRTAKVDELVNTAATLHEWLNLA